HRRYRHRADRGRRHALRGGRGRTVPARPPGRRGEPGQGGRDRGRALPPGDRPARPSRLQAAPSAGTHHQGAAHRDLPCPRADVMKLTVPVNGTDYTRTIEPRLLLIHFLRDDLGLTGSHWGCDTSNCGACVVWLDETPVKSCTMLAVQADGRRVTTVEGLA